MTKDPERLTTPIGIDMGTTSTVGACPVRETYQILLTEHGDSVPTEFAFGEDGFVIGDQAAARSDSVIPLPYVERTEQSMTATPRDVPLGVFFEKLLAAWPEVSPELPTDGSYSGDESDQNAGDENDVENDLTGEETPVETAEDDRTEPNMAADEGESDPRSSNGVLGSSRKKSGPDASTERLVEYTPTTITVPGGYSAEDITNVERIVTGAGFGDVRAVHSPLAVAGAELPTVDSKTIIGIADIGTKWAEFAVVTIDPSGTLTVQARTTLSGHGRTALDDRLVKWALKQAESEYDIGIECTDAAKARLRDAVHDAVNNVDPDGESTGSVDIELSDGVTVTDGGMLGMDAVPIRAEFDINTCIHALQPMLEEIQQTAGSMLDDIPDVDIDELVLAGDGTRLAPVLIAIENAFGIRSRPPNRGDRYTAAAIGAATISDRRATETEVITRETISDTIVLQAMGESGLETRPISTSATANGSTVTADLSLIAGDQLSGIFQLGFRHRITGDVRDLQTYSCANIQIGTSTVTVSVEPTAPRITGETIRVSASPETTTDHDSTVSVQPVEESSAPWLAHAGVDTTDVSTGDIGPTLKERGSDRAKALESLDSTGVARASWKMRNRIWEQGIRADEELTGDEIRLFLRELDKNLRIEGVEIIEPNVGERLNTDRHSVASPVETDEPEGTILEVLSPGFAVEGTVIEPAEIKAAR